MEILKGTGVALVTPFNEDLTIDFDGLLKLLEHTAKGVDYFVVQGTTGESATTTAAEKAEILSFVKKNNKTGLPIVYGIGGNNTQSVLDNIKSADLDGVDAILSVSPYYNKPSQEGIYQHFKMIADASPVPVILYNVPGRTQSNISANTTLRLAQHKNIVAIKEASGDLTQCMSISNDAPEDFLLISGDDLLTTPMMATGAVGVISVLANAFPEIFKRITKAAFSADFKASSEATFELIDINPLMYAESNPVGIKQVLEEFGICKNYVRMPLLPASEDLKTKIKALL
ncbi:dihydrodipicolinate synthase [Roseivirga seohaensis subsp. aquiponti]|uniref:4-hydroxy-tetrahydrodipicolinate synthase n=1 Tax=Roseivirga seohaensis subsp. aquiponti TaxID=1566026 RepID=A0A0L8AIA9_9BACT|nr:4-hydroxy-tetrahydrodipicolinate synthase [Roseivirga seohaensis]KOF02128.1 dihydrodipicolinate synthase [Roseivirga seohaensis subsp. aquiponti]